MYNKTTYRDNLRNLRDKINILLQMEDCGISNDIVKLEIVKIIKDDAIALENIHFKRPIQSNEVF